MTTTDQSNALATREFSDKQILTRIKAASEPGFGLAGATAAQQNMIYLLARHYDVDPAVDITLFRDRPWFTIDGRVRLMKRHPQYRGYETRPVVGPEKESWGYKADDLVIECAIRTDTWGTIKARGKVSAAEMRMNAPTGSHPSEMAEKRAIARASRLAFGQDVPDEDEVGYLIEERNDPQRVALNAATYDRVIASNYDDEFVDQRPEVQPVADAEPVEMVKGVRSAVYQELVELIHAASAGGLDTDRFKVELPAPLAEVKRKIAEIQQAIEQSQAEPAQVAF